MGQLFPFSLHPTIESSPPFKVDAFLELSTAKIASIRSATASSLNARLSVLNEIISLELRTIIMSAATFLVQQLINDLHVLPFLNALCNRSIQEAHLHVLTSQKRSILLPKLKRDRLDSSDPSNNRPSAIVTFMLKMLERTIVSQLPVYLDMKGLLPSFQSVSDKP